VVARSRGIRGHPSRILDGEACCRMGPGASERLSCVYPSSGRFGPFWG